MKALRLKLFQETACYKKPFAFKVSETYPLPPYSTVKGMLHTIMDAHEFVPMKLSIQGIYETIATDYQTHYFFKRGNTNEFALTMDGLDLEREMSDVTTMPIYMHILYNVHLIIHVHAEEEILNKLKRDIYSTSTHLSLGRWEDLARIDECSVVELHECSEEPLLAYNAFVPTNILDYEPHFPYKLNWKYRIIDGVRVWDKISVGYVQEGVSIENYEKVMVDPYGDYVFFP